jgi:hypothetical protein
MYSPPIIDHLTFEAVQQSLSERKRNSFRNVKHQYLLQHLLYCGHCRDTRGKESRYTPRTHSNGRRAYACYHRMNFKAAAGHEGIKWNWTAGLLEEPVKEFLYRLDHEPKAYAEMFEMKATRLKAEVTSAQGEVSRLEKRLAELGHEEDRILEGWEKGAGVFYRDEVQMLEHLARCRAEQDRVREELPAARDLTREELTLQETIEWLQSLKELHSPGPGYFDEETGERRDLEFEDWRDRATRLISRIWVEDDGSLLIEGPGGTELARAASLQAGPEIALCPSCDRQTKGIVGARWCVCGWSETVATSAMSFR